MADAEAGGSDVSVGAAIAINVVITDTTARTLRSLSGDDGVAVRITSIALTAASAEAGAKGASESAENGNGNSDADGQAQNQVDGNTNTNGKASLPSSTEGTSQADSEAQGQSGNESKGTGVAASIAVNWLTENQAVDAGAYVANGRSLIASGGPVQVSATHHVDGEAKAIGYAISGSTNVGATLSLNKIEADARATVGNNVTLSGNSVTVSAETVTGEINEFKVWAVAAAGGTDSDTSVAASVGVNIVILNNEATIGNDATITADAGGITMNASTPMAMQNVAASGALGDTAVGAAVAVNVFTISTLATIGDDADIDASGAISLNALSSLDPMDLFEEDIPVIGDLAVTSVAVGGAVSGSSGGVAVGGSVVVDVILTTTTARIGDRADINASR